MKLITISVLIFCLITISASAKRGRIFNAPRVESDTQYPFLARLLVKIIYFHPCSGVLITPSSVLTAAHCMLYTDYYTKKTSRVEFVTVYLGSATERNGENEVKVNVTDTDTYVHIHENYSAALDHVNDIAVIQIPTVTISEYVIPAELPRRRCSKTLKVAGWGATSTNGPNALYAHHNDFTVLNKTYCHKIFMDGVRGDLEMYDTQICLLGNGSTSCQGDSGGPSIEGNVVYGIASYISSRGCEANRPMVYTRVASYSRWIREKCELNRQ